MYQNNEFYHDPHSYLHWIFNKAKEYLSKNSFEIMFGDLNSDIHSEKLVSRRYENTARLFRELCSETIVDFFRIGQQS